MDISSWQWQCELCSANYVIVEDDDGQYMKHPEGDCELAQVEFRETVAE